MADKKLNTVVIEENEGNVVEGNDCVFYKFKCTKGTDSKGKLKYSIQLDLVNKGIEKTCQFITNCFTLTDVMAKICNLVNETDSVFNYNNYLKYLLNRHMLLILLNHLLYEQKNYDTVVPKYQLSFRLNDKFLDVVIHNRKIIPNSYMKLLCKIDGKELSNVYSYKESGFYLSSYESDNSNGTVTVYKNKVQDNGSVMECVYFLTNLIRHESRKIFEKILPSSYSRSSIKTKDIYINIGRNNLIKSNNVSDEEAKCTVISSFIKFEELMEKGYGEFTVFLADSLPFELGYGQLDI